jgi:hypothetical protein
MHDGWCGELIHRTASLKLARPGVYYVLNPFAFPPVSERNQESPRRSKNIHWCPVDFARLPTYMRKNAEAGQSGGEAARDSVRNSQVEGCDPPFAEPD